MKVELMAPVGSFETLHSAINAGADSVYFGIEQLNMRARSSNNFTLEDLKEIVSVCNKNNVKAYLALNTIMYDHDINLMKRICDTAKEMKISSIIASDVSAMQYAKSINLPVHISTQANVTNIEAVKFYSLFSDVIVLARELTLKQIKNICVEINKQNICGPCGSLIKIEVFVHGALCVAISGKCYMSLATYNSSANRGACLQNCRRSYRVIDIETNDELVLENKYIMSPKDLCTVGFLDMIIDAGISVLKIEGRARKADYVHTVVSVYREALDSISKKEFTPEKIKEWETRLKRVYNRGFWRGGYYLGKRLGEWSGDYGSQATTKKEYVGRCLNFYDKKCVGLFKIESGELRVGDKVIITGTTTGYIECKIKEMFVNEIKKSVGVKGDEITFILQKKIRSRDKLFIVRELDKCQK